MNELIIEYNALKKELETLREKELVMRKFLVHKILENPEEGSYSKVIDDNKFNIKYIVNRRVKTKYMKDLIEYSDEYNLDLFRKTTSFNNTAYKKLDEHHKGIVDNYITSNIGTPTLEIIKINEEK